MGIQVFQGAARQRARLIARVRQLESKIEIANNEINELRDRIGAYDAVLKEQNINIDPEEYLGHVPAPRRGYFRHGMLASLCLEALFTARGPVSTPQLLRYAADKAGVSFASALDRAKSLDSVKNQMGTYARKGIVVRVEQSHRTPGDVRYWALPEFASEPIPDLPVAKAHVRSYESTIELASR